MGKVKDEMLFGLIRDYLLIYLPNQRHASQNTVKSYRTTWNQLLRFIAEKNRVKLMSVTFEMINYMSVTEYMKWLSEEKNASISTQNNRLAAIRAFLDYASACRPEYISLSGQLDAIKVPKKPRFEKIDYMSEEAVKTLLNTPDVHTRDGLRDQFFMIFLYDTGARVQEVLNVRLCDIKLGKTPTVLLHGKGNKIRTVPLMQDTVTHMKNYMSAFHKGTPIEAPEYLFYVERKGKRNPMNDDTARLRLQKYVKPAREKCPDVPENIHPHLWRHTRAMHLYQHGMDLTLVSQWLGHSQLETTQIYAYADTETKRKAIERAMSSTPGMETIETYKVSDEELLRKLYGL